MRPQDPSPRRFFADAMLGRLARWLRMLGHDTAYERVIADESLIERAIEEQRWLLTRDRYLARRRAIRGRCTVLVSDAVVEQLRQLVNELGLDLPRAPGSDARCPECNGLLLDMPNADASPFVPPYVAAHHDRFARCEHCRHIYWRGTHWAHVERVIDRLRPM